jgi:GMP synthase-like glutamine amidotransferase
LTRTLLIVDPSLAWPETQGVAEIADLWGGAVHVWTPVLDPGSRPSGTAADHAGAVLLGSRASVHDASDWRREVDEVLRPVVDGRFDRPFLGVCFGHQWLAHVAGGAVEFARRDRSKILGVRSTTFRGGRWFPDGTVLRVVASHREVVVRLPPGHRAVACRPDSRYDAIEHEARPLWGVQFHPEARGDFATSSGIDAAELDARTVADSRRVLRAFLEVARG